MPPYTAWAAPPRQRRASNDDANARAKAFSAAIRDGTGSAVGDADGAPGWGRFQSTRFTDANGSSTTEQNNREACARALQAERQQRRRDAEAQIRDYNLTHGHLHPTDEGATTTRRRVRPNNDDDDDLHGAAPRD